MTTEQSEPEQLESVEALDETMHGRWAVESQGSVHVWDLDAMTYSRHPGPDSPSGAFDYDGIEHRITRVTSWPSVGGQSFIWYDDPQQPYTREQFRRSSVIVSIRRIAEVEEDDGELVSEGG